MSATATLNIRLPEELKEHGMQVLARQHISVSEAVRQLFCELERSHRNKSGNKTTTDRLGSLRTTQIDQSGLPQAS